MDKGKIIQPKKGSSHRRTRAVQKEEVHNQVSETPPNEEDPFISVSVAFSCSLELCWQLIHAVWKEKWSTDAICYQ